MKKSKRWIVEKLGGYNDINEALEAIKDIKQKRQILTNAVKNLFNTIGPDDILKENDFKQWMSEGKPLNDADKQLLVGEALTFIQSKLWKVLQNDIRYQSNRKMFLHSRTDDDLTMGKMWLYTLDCIKTRLDSIIKNSGKFNAK